MNEAATQVGDAVISSRCLDVPGSMFSGEELNEIVEDMRAINNKMGGIGISANQVGHSYRISLVHIKPTEARPDRVDEGELLMINPEVVLVSGNNVDEWEGCLSVAEAGIFAKVSRPESVTVAWLQADGTEVTKTFSGFMARVVQHELAHLDGRVFLQEPGVNLNTLNSRSEYIAKKNKGEI